eukprot:gnl/TRDRNA2_/TRDRNA2_35565_c0_seq1.p1 gnl/TRDRNA2_/TRDRNA2_35565_c0~~gnl/TRDRNA2_/TRDRNA2_35565_c0_seq1.p1  ORF type:complete len:263 (+),score=47.63 gnl/TRDRNA2_/TRDRNA2_35565_c0_seq1:42-830(+)
MDYEFTPRGSRHIFQTRDGVYNGAAEAPKSEPSSPPSSPPAERKGENPRASESGDENRVRCRGNHIYFFAGVTKDSVYRMNEYITAINTEFRALRRQHPLVEMKPPPIFLHVNSFGGSVFAAFAAVDFIKQSALPIYTIVEGAVASAGTLISIAGVKRFIRPTASMLIHELESWFGGKMTKIDDEYKNLQQMMNSIRALYKSHTRLADTELESVLKHDLWWTADVCIDKGLADALWQGDGRDEDVDGRDGGTGGTSAATSRL